MIERYYVFSFQSVSYAMNAESLFKYQEISYKTIPTPREISSSCGLAIRFDESLLDEVKEKVMDKINYHGLYLFTKDEEGKRAEKII